ncbi:5'/3'-nucleotidase SurE [Halorubrum distributum]|uniref:5'-nucleotidase SurE n=4 Tax=Halorubrum distributum TaxID=29283 RepID=M0NNQ8_9EURY|nr:MULTISPECIES: 5'/3'-nucleotidase SurE [Halorubrum distributum group]PHQ45455.1 5'/3'-nucleotidase SurE [Halorubrum sp. C3]ELZ32276.1 stationary-phase survival protein SurE [Halorubrum terrestre JCM 10247]EMA59552.1 stationary-phase survival protein SurE [Halorubrum litoreum JCM 13561]EMA69619.1 stationary-phase survival protein SurE [Halorubrum arcis JCM 13916]MYL15574.1 5'/3'-nucleotidase SurE [Halorubrum terrestre]
MPTEILLTNDDGIDAVGIRALADALSRDYDVTVVAPATNQSGVGGARSWWETTVDYTETDRGYAVEGTPADCVAVADVALGLDPDVVVSGCNHGPNIGAHILGQSGTVGAAMEASFLGTPAIAVSLYDRGNLPVPPTLDNGDFAVAGEVVADLLDRAERGESGDPLALPFGADVLNVNVPAADDEAAADPTYRLTEPARGFDVIEFRPGEEGPDDENVPEGWEFGERRGEMGMELRDRFWREFLRGNVQDDPGSDRRAAVEGEVSISPLSSSRSVAGGKAGELVEPARGAETGAD